MAAQQTQQVHHIARPKTLLFLRQTAPAVEQAQQKAPRSHFTLRTIQSLKDRPAYESLLRLAHIVLGLRADQRLFDQDTDLAPSDLVSSGLHESISHVLEHHRLQSEGRAAFAVFNQ